MPLSWNPSPPAADRRQRTSGRVCVTPTTWSSPIFHFKMLTSGQPRGLLRETTGEENHGKPVRMCERRRLHLWFPDHLDRRGGPPAPDRQPPGDGARGQDPHRDDREL